MCGWMGEGCKKEKGSVEEGDDGGKSGIEKMWEGNEEGKSRGRWEGIEQFWKFILKDLVMDLANFDNWYRWRDCEI